jgi:hypothetical protein
VTAAEAARFLAATAWTAEHDTFRRHYAPTLEMMGCRTLSGGAEAAQPVTAAGLWLTLWKAQGGALDPATGDLDNDAPAYCGITGGPTVTSPEQ